MNLDHHTLFAHLQVPHLGHTVSGSTDFQEDFPLHGALRRRDHQLRVLRVSGCTSSKVSLMLFSLRVSEVRAFVRVQC